MESCFWSSHEGSCVQVASSPQTRSRLSALTSQSEWRMWDPEVGLQDAPLDELEII